MQMSKTWQARLRHGRDRAGRIARLVVAMLALSGGLAAVKVFVAPDRPDLAAMSRQVNNEQAQVGAFAADFVLTWLTATSTCRDQDPAGAGCRDGDRAVLARFLTLPEDAALALPSTPAAVVSSPQVVSVIDTGTRGDAESFAAVVAVDERPYASAPSTRAFYRVPISMWHYQTRAVTLPARINGPGPGADLALGYHQALSTTSPVYAVASGFVHTYLTSSTGLDRYVVAGTALTPAGGYQSAVVTSAATAEIIPDTPASGTEINVLATVLAQTAQFATVTMTYPLTVENSGGTWMVSAIDSMPRTDSAGRATR